MTNTPRANTVDQVLANPKLMHRAEWATLVHLHNLNLEGSDEDFQDTDDEFESLEVTDEEEVFMDFQDHIDFDPIFD